MTNKKEKGNFCLPQFIETKFVTWEYHMYDSDKGTYNMILRRDLLTDLELNLKILQTRH